MRKLAALLLVAALLAGCANPDAPKAPTDADASTSAPDPVVPAPVVPVAPTQTPTSPTPLGPAAPAPPLAPLPPVDNGTGNATDNGTVDPPVFLASGTFTATLHHAGLERHYSYYVPANLPANRSAPLLVLLHGGTGNAENVLWKTLIRPVADVEGFLILAPDGTPTATDESRFRWQALDCCGPTETDIDDDGFILAAMAALRANFTIDAARIGIAGHSEGGSMAYVTAVHAPPGTFRFTAAVAGTIGLKQLPVGRWHYVDAPTEPMNVLILHSTDDNQIPYDGGRGTRSPDPWAAKASVQEAIDLFTAPLGGFTETIVDDGSDVQVQTYRSATTDHRVVHIRTIGGHGWPAGIESSVFPYNVLVSTPPRPDTSRLVADWLVGDLP